LLDQVPTAQSSSIFRPPVRRQTSTLRRRSTIKPTSVPQIDSQVDEEEEEEEEEEEDPNRRRFSKATPASPVEEEPMQDDDADPRDLSNAESFTLKDRQLAINQTHPFEMRIWQPVLCKKSHHSIDEKAEKDIHSTLGGSMSIWLWFFNTCWTLLFGWWLAAASLLGASVSYLSVFANAPGATDYGLVFWGLAGYVLWPFGKFMNLESDEIYAEEDEGYGGSPRDYEQWQSGDL
jgi:Ca2+:H+ antiporter